MSKVSEEMSENATELLKLARKRFGKINEAEEKLFRCFADGEVADYSAEKEKDNDPSKADKWGRERVLDADRISWFCTDRKALEFVTHRGIRVKGARIDGELDLSYARISFPLYFKKSAFTKEIYLQHAEIRSLNLVGTHTGPIYGDGLRVDECVFLREVKAKGLVDLVAATIGTDFDCSGGRFINEGTTALSANRANIKANVFLSAGFKADGEVDLIGATIGGDLICIEGQFINNGRYSLRADSMKVKGHVYMRGGFKAEGTVNLDTTAIDGGLQWRDVNSPEGVTLSLSFVTVGVFWDDKESWPEKGKLFLHGFVYNEIDERAPRDAKSRIEWLRRQKDFSPQPYEQLAAVLGRGGQEEDARKILITKNKDKARLTELKTRSEKIWYRVLGPMIGYGYRPLNALWGVLLFVVLGWIFFGFGYRCGLVSPESESAYAAGDKGIAIPGDERKLSEVYPRYNFLIYSVDTFVPLIDLHQSKYWLPNANRGYELFKIKGVSLHVGGLLRFYLWIHIVMGWALTTLLVVGLTGLVRT